MDQVLPRLPGAQAVVYDGAFRGVHLRHLITSHDIVPIASVHEAKVTLRRVLDTNRFDVC